MWPKPTSFLPLTISVKFIRGSSTLLLHGKTPVETWPRISVLSSPLPRVRKMQEVPNNGILMRFLKYGLFNLLNSLLPFWAYSGISSPSLCSQLLSPTKLPYWTELNTVLHSSLSPTQSPWSSEKQTNIFSSNTLWQGRMLQNDTLESSTKAYMSVGLSGYSQISFHNPLFLSDINPATTGHAAVHTV